MRLKRWNELNDWYNEYEELKTKRKAGDVRSRVSPILYSESAQLDYKSP